MPQPILTTDRLVLLPLADEHLEAEVELDSDPEVLRFLFPGARSRAAVVAAHERRMAQGREVDGLGMWMGFLADVSGDIRDWVGLFMLTPPHGPDRPADPEGQADLGYRVRRSLWRQGLAGEGSRELLRHGFGTLGLRRIYAQTMAVNEPSRATMRSLGLTHVRSWAGTWDEPVAGAEHGEVEYAITRDEWGALRSP